MGSPRFCILLLPGNIPAAFAFLGVRAIPRGPLIASSVEQDRRQRYSGDWPGRWYLQAITALFKENRLATGTFVALGTTVSLKSIRVPLYLLAGESDDITTKGQVFNTEELVGTPKHAIVKKLVPGGHIGLFMGSHTLRHAWPEIGAWFKRQRG